jgi:hypothetical protein
MKTSTERLAYLFMERAEVCRGQGDLKKAGTYQRMADELLYGDFDIISASEIGEPLLNKSATDPDAESESSVVSKVSPTFLITIHRDKNPEPESIYNPNDFMGRDTLTANSEEGVRVYAKFPQPAYCFLIALNSDGSDQLCFPRDEAVPPPMIKGLEFPEDDNQYYQLKDATGLQAFVMVTSPMPLPSYVKWKEKSEIMPWQNMRTDGAWGYDGTRYNRLGANEESLRSKVVMPKALYQTMSKIKKSAGQGVVSAVAFPVVKKN